MSFVVTLMVKNEVHNIVPTIESIKDHCDAFYVLDTGSTDNTSEVIEKTVNKKCPLFVKSAPWTDDFAASRNHLVSLIKTKREVWVLMLDAGDEVRGAEQIKPLLESHATDSVVGLRVKIVQRLASSDWKGVVFLRLFKLLNENPWKYVGAIHEQPLREGVQSLVKYTDAFTIFQDRISKAVSSHPRFERDLRVLQQNPSNPRNTFYLAYTQDALGNLEEARRLYTERLGMGGNNRDELYFTCYQLGFTYIKEMHTNLDQKPMLWSRAHKWLWDAYCLSNRAEPLYNIALYYLQQQIAHVSYAMSKLACECPYPHATNSPIDESIYVWKRFELLGMSAYMMNKTKEAKEALELAIARCDKDYDCTECKRILEECQKGDLFVIKN